MILSFVYCSEADAFRQLPRFLSRHKISAIETQT